LKSERQHWPLKRIFSTAVLFVAALLWWAYTEQVNSPEGGAAMFACAVACLVGALWPRHGLALVIAGVMALAFDKTRLEAPNVWNITFLILSSAGLGHLFRRRRLLAWIGASFPFWAMSSAVPPLIYVALGFSFIGLVLTSVHPMLSRTRRTGVAPLPQLAKGPLVAVPARLYEFKRGTKSLKAITILCGVACLTGIVLLLGGFSDVGITLAWSAGILGLTFAFSLWFNARLHFRIDNRGIHSRVFFGEKSIPWEELGCLTLRYVCFPGFGLNYVYYCVLSPSKEITFPNNMAGADELRELIEQASGLNWPVPEITPAK
jgi:hypothetical protein